MRERQKPVVFNSFLQAFALLSHRDMRRCCFFFLAFVAAIFLAVVTGSFENRKGFKNKGGDTAQTAIATQKDKKLPEQSPLEMKAADIFKKIEP